MNWSVWKYDSRDSAEWWLGEFAEYFTFSRGGPEEEAAYTDTLGDLAGGLTGSTLAALLTVTIVWRSRKEPVTNRFRSG